ncbi:MAG: uroporphyrinogen decarboxylase family protein [Thermoproteota archaeon]
MTDELIRTCGLSWQSVHRQADHMVKAALYAKDFFEFENIRIPFDQCVEAEALGAELFEGRYPMPKRFLEEVDFQDLIGRGRTLIVIEAIRNIRNMYNGNVPIIGGVTRSFTALNYLLGPAKVLVLNTRHQNILRRYLDRLSKLISDYAMEMVHAGADAIVIEDMASSPDVLNPSIFKSIGVP